MLDHTELDNRLPVDPRFDRNEWMQTAKGNAFFPYAAKPEDFDIEEIAHALSNICRFGGHTLEFYSVAQHSVIVADAIIAQGRLIYALEGLLHDAAEAYIGDMIRPIKHDGSAMGELFCSLEENLMDGISERFSLVWSPVRQKTVRWADNTALATEARDVMAKPPRPWHPLPPPLEQHITPLAPREAKALFLQRFMELSRGTENRGRE